MEKLERKVIYITVLGHSLCHIYMLVFAGALVPIAESLGVSITEITALGTVAYFFFGLCSLPSGLLATRINAKFTLKLFFACTAIASMLTGITNSKMLFGIGLALIGVSASLYHVSGLTLISHCVEKKGRAMGIHGIAGSAGIAIAPVIAGAIVTLLGWRYIYLLMTIPGLLCFLFLLFDREIPPAHAEIPERQSASKQQYRMKLFVMAVCIMGLNGLVYRGFLTALPTYMSQKISIPNMSAVFTGGMVSTLILSIGMVSQYMGGYLSDKVKNTRLYFSLFVLTLPFMILMGYTENYLLIGSAVLFTLFHFPSQPVENHIISSFIPSRYVSAGFGVKFILVFGVGSFATVFVGYMADHFNMSYVFPILGCVIVLAVIVAGWLNVSAD
jgi:MFS family permease